MHNDEQAWHALWGKWHDIRCKQTHRRADIGENLQEALGFPDKANRRASPGEGWTPDELNHILQAHVVDGSLTTFGCVEWESELFRGVMRARCYPFKMPKHRFYSFNPQVFIPYYSSTYLYILCACYYVLVHTGTYHYIL